MIVVGRNIKQHRQCWWGLTEKAVRECAAQKVLLSTCLPLRLFVPHFIIQPFLQAAFYLFKDFKGQSEEASLPSSAKQVLIWADGLLPAVWSQGALCLLTPQRSNLSPGLL